MAIFGRIFENLCLSLLFFCGTSLTKQDFETICRSDPVAEGETAMMSISLRPQIDLVNDKVFIYLKKNGDSADTLRCDRQEPELQLKCKTIDGGRFHTGGLVDHDLKVIVVNVTDDLEGVYVLRVYVNHVPDPTTECVLSVLTATDNQLLAASEEDSSEVTPILISLFLVVVIAVIVGIILYRRRRKKQKKELNQSEQLEPMKHNCEENQAADGEPMNEKHKQSKTADLNIKEEVEPMNQTDGDFEFVEHADVADVLSAAHTATTETDTTENNINNGASTDNTTTDISSKIATASPEIPTTPDTSDGAESIAPSKQNRLQSARGAGRSSKPSSPICNVTEQGVTSDKNTTVAAGLIKGLDDERIDLRLKPGRRNKSEEEDMYYTAFDIHAMSSKDPSV